MMELKSLDELIKYAVLLVTTTNFQIELSKTITEVEKEDKFVDYKKELDGIVTDIVTNDFLKKKDTISNFIQSIVYVFDQALNRYCKDKGIDTNKIFFVYKGGNVLKVIAQEFIHELPGNAQDIFFEYYSKFFKKSDADFSIYIHPELENYDKVYEDITTLSYLLLNIMRIYFLLQPTYFDYNKNNRLIQMGILFESLENLNKAYTLQNTESTYYQNKIKSLALKDIHVDSNGDKLPPVETKRTDMYMEFMKPQEQPLSKPSLQPLSKPSSTNPPQKKYILASQLGGGKMMRVSEIKPLDDYADKSNLVMPAFIKKHREAFGSSKNSIYYISVNKTLKFISNNLPIEFNLVRMKVNFGATIERPNGSEKQIKLGAELIDVSIPKRTSTGIIEFFKDVSHNVSIYNYSSINYNFKFRGSSPQYMIHDLEFILFHVSKYPWEDVKYAKRINRLMFLYFVDMLLINKNDDINTRLYIVRNYLIKTKNNCFTKVVASDLEREYDNVMDVISGYVDRSQVEANKHNFVIKEFLTYYRSILRTAEEQIDDFKNFCKVVESNIDELVNMLDSIQLYITQDGKVHESTIFSVSQWGGKRNPYFNKYKKYKLKYLQSRQFRR